MTESIFTAASKGPTKAVKRRDGFKAALWIGGLLPIVTILIFWAETSKEAKVDNKTAIPEVTVPVAKADRETLTKDISLYDITLLFLY